MSNVLQSESFERAAYALISAFQQFERTVSHLGEHVQEAKIAVAEAGAAANKLQTLMGMHAENHQRVACGKQLAYDEASFTSVQ